jgi:hypothetical protein
MKIILFILFLLFKSYGIFAGDLDNFKLYNYDLNSHLKYKTLPKNTCDLCGCYMGIDGENRNEIGVRYRIRVFNGPHTNTGDPSAFSSIREYYNTVELYGRYILSPKVQISFSLPYGINSVEVGKFTGLGDLLVMTKYLVLGKISNQPGKIYNDRLFVGGGFKIPTGSYNKPESDGEVEPHFQTGTGSFDFLLLTTYIARIKSFGFNSDIVYKINTQNPNKYHFANRFNFSTSVLYILQTGISSAIIPNAGVYFEQANPDLINGTADDGSGGKVLFITGGVNVNLKHISLSLNYQKPVYENLIGYQPKNNFRLISSISYMF